MRELRHYAGIPWIGALALAALLCPSALSAQQAEAASYGYFRTIEGSARLTGASEPEAIDIETNYPVLPGDRVWVAPGARIEAVLPDGSLIRMGGGTDLFLNGLAASYETKENEGNVLRLFEGEVQIVIERTLPGVEPTRIDTGNATLYLPSPGVYRITADESGWTELIVREGYAEVATERGSSVVRTGEGAVIEGRNSTGVSLVAAGGPDRLESWGESLTAGARRATVTPHVAEPLRYAAAPLAHHGNWVSVGGSWAWRPRVAFGWRPYTSGRWIYTPAGITWVSSRPWGWVTSHYGSWDHAPGFGWVWHPGRVYSPAWVYWYWGPSHVAWVPAGFYTRYYGHHGASFGFGFGGGFQFGVYGWAGGAWSPWSRWTFCPTRYFGHPRHHGYWRSGAQLAHGGRYHAVPRGIVTNDTRSLHPQRWARPREAVFALEDQHRRYGKVVSGAAATRTLPDVSAFVARQKDLASDTRSAVFKSKLDGRPIERLPAERGVAGGATRKATLGATAAPWRTESTASRSLGGSRSRTPISTSSALGSRSRSLDSTATIPRQDRRATGSPVIGGGLRSSANGLRSAAPRADLQTVKPGSTGSRSLVGGSRPLASTPATPRSARPGVTTGPRVDTRVIQPSSVPPSPRFSTPSARRDAGPLVRTPVERSGETPLVRRIVEGARSSAGASPGVSQRPTTGVRRSSPSASGSGGPSSVRRPSGGSSSSGTVRGSTPSRPPSSARGSSAPRSKSRATGSGRSAKPKRKSKPNGK